jgi:nucleoside-diphosphate-sugar epimerase
MSAVRHALVVGASGLVGGNFLRFLSEGGADRITTMSRRAPEPTPGVRHLPVDLLDRAQCDAVAPQLADTTHVFFCARAVGQNYDIRLDPNREIVENLLDALLPVAHALRHVQIIHGMKWYGSNLGPYKQPAEESDPRLPGPNFYYEQLDAITRRQPQGGWSWSTLRPHFVCGVTVGSPSNPLSTIGTYAAILKELGRPLDFPGPQGSFDARMNIADVRLLARAMLWAATDPRCANQAYNVVNGDTFRWCELWPRLAEHFGMAPGAVRPVRLRDDMADKDPVWQRVIARHGLKPTRMIDIADWAFADVLFDGAWDQTASMAKARRDGFTQTVDTPSMVFEILGNYRSLRLLP